MGTGQQSSTESRNIFWRLTTNLFFPLSKAVGERQNNQITLKPLRTPAFFLILYSRLDTLARLPRIFNVSTTIATVALLQGSKLDCASSERQFPLACESNLEEVIQVKGAQSGID
jgi:hypothetical protein